MDRAGSRIKPYSRFLLALLGILLAILQPSMAHSAGYEGGWSDDCESGENAFLLKRDRAYDRYRITICYGFGCKELPGFEGPVDLDADRRIRVFPDGTLTFLEGLFKGIVFHRCIPVEEPETKYISGSEVGTRLIGVWQAVGLVNRGAAKQLGRYSEWRLTFTQTGKASLMEELEGTEYRIWPNGVIAIFARDTNKGIMKPQWLPWLRVVDIDKERLVLDDVTESTSTVVTFRRIK